MIYSGHFTQHEHRRIAIVVSRFNDLITEQLLKGAQTTLVMHGVAAENISVFWVPGAFEIQWWPSKSPKRKPLMGL